MEKTHKVGIFLNQNHINYYSYGMFLARQTCDLDNVHLHGFNNYTEIVDIPVYDTNIYLNRYAYLRLDKIKKLLKNTLYLLPGLSQPSIVIHNTDNKKQRKKILVSNYLSSLQTVNYTNITQYSHLRNLGAIGSSVSQALLVSFDDEASGFMQELQSFHDNKKLIFYNKKVYEIGYEDLFFERDKIIAKLSRNVRVIWNNKRNMWIKYKIKRKIKC